MKKISNNQINTKQYWDIKHQNNRFPAIEAYLLLLSYYRQFIKLYGWSDPLSPKVNWLDFGCGNAVQRFEIIDLPKDVKYIGCDISPAVIRNNIKHNDYLKNVRFVNFPSDKFKYELITSMHTFEHLDDPIAIWHNLWKRTNNYLIIQVPYKESCNCPEHIWHFSEKAFSDISPKPLILLSPPMNVNRDEREIVFIWSKKHKLKKAIFLKPFENTLSPFGWVSLYLNIGYVPYAYSWLRFLVEKLIPLNRFSRIKKKLKGLQIKLGSGKRTN